MMKTVHIDILNKQSDGLVHQYDVEIPAHDVQIYLEKKIAEVAGQVKMPGYRPGHVPLKLVARRFAKDIADDVANDLVEKSFSQLVEQDGLSPAVSPVIDCDMSNRLPSGGLNPDCPFRYHVRIECHPDIVIPAFEDFVLTSYRVVPDAQDVDLLVARFREKNMVYEPRPEGEAVALGDSVRIEGSLKIYSMDKAEVLYEVDSLPDSEVMIADASEEKPLSHKGVIFPEGTAVLVGYRVNDLVEKDYVLPHQLPSFYKDYAGHPASVSLVIQSIELGRLPVMDDAFAKKFNTESVDELRDLLRQQSVIEIEKALRARLRKDLLDTLEPECMFDVPPTLLRDHAHAIWTMFLDERGYKNDDEARADLADYDEIFQKYQRVAKRQVLLGLLVIRVAEVQNISVSESEWKKEVERRIMNTPESFRPFAVEILNKNPRVLHDIRKSMLEERVLDYMLSRVTIESQDATIATLERIFDEENAAEDDIL